VTGIVGGRTFHLYVKGRPPWLYDPDESTVSGMHAGKLTGARRTATGTGYDAGACTLVIPALGPTNETLDPGAIVASGERLMVRSVLAVTLHVAAAPSDEREPVAMIWLHGMVVPLVPIDWLKTAWICDPELVKRVAMFTTARYWTLATPVANEAPLFCEIWRVPVEAV